MKQSGKPMRKNYVIRPGIHIPADIRRQSMHSIAIVASFADDGTPHTSSVQYMYPKGSYSILMAVPSKSAAYYNMVWRKKISLCFISRGETCNILGHIGVVKAPSEVLPSLSILRFDAITLWREERDDITSGIGYRAANDDYADLADSILKELCALSESI